MRRIAVVAVLVAASLLAPPQAGAIGDQERTLERVLLKFINELREKKGLDPIVEHNFIRGQARDHSEHMALTQTLTHDGLQGRKDAIAAADDGINANKICENVGRGLNFDGPRPVAQGVYNGWRGSPEHRACLLDDVFTKESGAVGAAKRGKNWYVTFIAAHDTT